MKVKDIGDASKGHWKWGCATLLLWPVRVAIEALTVWLFWGWFVVPLGVRSISVAHAFAFGAFVAVYFPVSSTPDAKPDDETVGPRTMLLRHAAKWATLPLAGWLVHLAIGRGW